MSNKDNPQNSDYHSAYQLVRLNALKADREKLAALYEADLIALRQKYTTAMQPVVDAIVELEGSVRVPINSAERACQAKYYPEVSS